MTNGAELRVGVIGLDRAGRVHLDAWRAVPGVRVAAVCDPAPAVVHAASSRATRVALSGLLPVARSGTAGGRSVS